MRIQMRQELGRSQGLLAEERTGRKDMRILRHERESRNGTMPKSAPAGHRHGAGRETEPRGEATEGSWEVGSIHSTRRR